MSTRLAALFVVVAFAGCGHESAADHNAKLRREYNAATKRQHEAECSLWGKHCP